MVMYKYCPRCCSLDVIKEMDSNSYKCRGCNYVGPVNMDSIDRINSLRIKVKGGINYNPPVQQSQKTTPSNPSRSTSSTSGVAGKDYEILRKKDDVFSSEIPVIDKGGEDIEIDPEPEEDLTPKATTGVLPVHGLRPKETKSLKERLREKGAGKDWDIV